MRDAGTAADAAADGLTAIVLHSAPGDVWLLDRLLFGLATSSLAGVQAVVVIRDGTAVEVAEAAELLLRQPFPGEPTVAADVAEMPGGALCRRIGGHVVVAVPGNGTGPLQLLAEGERWANGRFLSFFTVHSAPYHRALESLVRRALASQAAVVVGCSRRVFVRRPPAGGAGYTIRKSAPLTGDGLAAAALFGASSPLYACLVDRRVAGPEPIFVTPAAPGAGSHDWLVALAGRQRYDFCGLPVNELLTWTDPDDLFAAIDSDWEESRVSVTAAFLLNFLAGARLAGRHRWRRLAAPLLKPVLARQRRRRALAESPAGEDA